MDKALTATVDIRVSIAEEDTYAIDLSLHLQYLDLLQVLKILFLRLSFVFLRQKTSRYQQGIILND